MATVTMGNTSVHICVLWEERFSIIALNLGLTRRGREREGREGRREREREGRERGRKEWNGCTCIRH